MLKFEAELRRNFIYESTWRSALKLLVFDIFLRGVLNVLLILVLIFRFDCFIAVLTLISDNFLLRIGCLLWIEPSILWYWANEFIFFLWLRPSLS